MIESRVSSVSSAFPILGLRAWPVIVFLGRSNIDAEGMSLYLVRWEGGMIVRLKVVLSKREYGFLDLPPSLPSYSPFLWLWPLCKLTTWLGTLFNKLLVLQGKKMPWFIAYANFCDVTVPTMMSSSHQWFNNQITESLKFNSRLSWACAPLRVPSLLSWSPLTTSQSTGSRSYWQSGGFHKIPGWVPTG